MVSKCQLCGLLLEGKCAIKRQLYSGPSTLREAASFISGANTQSRRSCTSADLLPQEKQQLFLNFFDTDGKEGVPHVSLTYTCTKCRCLPSPRSEVTPHENHLHSYLRSDGQGQALDVAHANYTRHGILTQLFSTDTNTNLTYKLPTTCTSKASIHECAWRFACVHDFLC